MSTVQIPVYREWFTDEGLDRGTPLLEFRLVYQGLLRSNGDSLEKQSIRRYLHRQLYNVWRTKHPLKGREKTVTVGDQYRRWGIDDLANKYAIPGKRLLPIVSEELALTCELDILMLRRDLGALLTSGDLDNRIKTLLDALRLPKPGENMDGDEDPLYCLLEDDKLVSELRVIGDHLFAEPEQVIEHPKVTPTGVYTANPSHVCAIIHVKIHRTRSTFGNFDFV
jgi:hypothetical protein